MVFTPVKSVLLRTHMYVKDPIGDVPFEMGTRACWHCLCLASPTPPPDPRGGRGHFLGPQWLLGNLYLNASSYWGVTWDLREVGNFPRLQNLSWTDCRQSPALLTSSWLPGPAPAHCLCMPVSACYAALNEDKQMCSSHWVQVWMMWSFSSRLAIFSLERSRAASNINSQIRGACLQSCRVALLMNSFQLVSSSREFLVQFVQCLEVCLFNLFLIR